MAEPQETRGPGQPGQGGRGRASSAPVRPTLDDNDDNLSDRLRTRADWERYLKQLHNLLLSADGEEIWSEWMEVSIREDLRRRYLTAYEKPHLTIELGRVRRLLTGPNGGKELGSLKILKDKAFEARYRGTFHEGPHETVVGSTQVVVPRPRVSIRGTEENPKVHVVETTKVTTRTVDQTVRAAVMSPIFNKRFKKLCRVPADSLAFDVGDKYLKTAQLQECAKALSHLLLDKMTNDLVKRLVKDRGGSHSNERLRSAMKDYIVKNLPEDKDSLLKMIKSR
jgi:hypothetical protein